MVEESTRWNPWRDLRASPDVIFDRCPIPAAAGAVSGVRGRRAVILIDPALTAPERNAALGHELVHIERGGLIGGHPDHPLWAYAEHREETTVRRITARRLVPLAELAQLLDTAADMGHSPEPWELAEEFGVTEAVVADAMAELAREGYGERWVG